MNDGEAKPAARQQKSRKRKFFMVCTATVSRASGYELLNKAVLFKDGPPFFARPDGRRGFRDYPEQPVFMADPKRGRLHWDLEEVSGYCWFVSERMKSVLQEVDPEAVAFLQCDMRSPGGEPHPPRWLCDMVQILDALDEDQSETTIRFGEGGNKFYSGIRSSKLVFKEDIVGRSHVFRLKFSDEVFCDQELRTACKAAGLKGISFRPTE